MTNSTINYGKLIKKARDSRNLSQKELARKLSVGKSTISNYETGYSTPSLEMFTKIANALEYSVIDMLYFDDSQSKENNLEFPRAVQPSADCYIPYYTPKSIKSGNFEHQKYMDSYLTLPGFMVSDSNEKYMCIKMPDSSMDSDGIAKNDYIIVKRSSFVPNKAVVLAQRILDGEFFVRRYFRDNHIIALLPSSTSEEYSIIRSDERNGEYKIIGFVEKVLTNLR
ncbi:MAG: helix-turn-helix domain-containing protein [Clostridia bacterium]|nr:helix-turn-helix domain-containing protein [Clostridia bacterium]